MTTIDAAHLKALVREAFYDRLADCDTAEARRIMRMVEGILDSRHFNERLELLSYEQEAVEGDMGSS